MYNKGTTYLTVLIFYVTIGFTEELTWTTKMRTSTGCQGNKHLLMWSFSTKDNEKVTELDWFFNENTLVCLASNTNGFLVSDLYKGRVERNGEAGILLKNVSFNDEGEYTLHVKLEDEKEPNIQGISLTVVEPPPNQCKPIIGTKHPKGIISCSTFCEKSPLSLEWIINGTQEPVGIGPYFLVDSSWTSEKAFCCLRDFKCHDDDQFKFCTPNHISFTEDTDSGIQYFKDRNHMILIILIFVIMMVAVSVIQFIILKRRRRRCHKWHDTENQTTLDHNELDTLVVSEPLKLKNQCNEKHEDVNDAAAITDQPLQDSNQHVESVKNISIYTDLIKSMTHLSTSLVKELQANRTETRKLRRRITYLGRKQKNCKYSFRRHK